MENEESKSDLCEAIRLDPQEVLSYRDRYIAWGGRRKYNRAIAY